jgi:hypothetical protein
MRPEICMTLVSGDLLILVRLKYIVNLEKFSVLISILRGGPIDETLDDVLRIYFLWDVMKEVLVEKEIWGECGFARNLRIGVLLQNT